MNIKYKQIALVEILAVGQIVVHSKPSCDIINESFLSNLISIYPNPANNTLNIEIDKDYLSKTDINIYLYDVIGKLMKEINNNDIINNIIQINLTSFADGIYYLNIQTSDGSMVKKIVIQR